MAIENFNNVIRLTPDSAKAFNNRGFTYAQIGLYKKSFEDYHKVISIKSDDDNFYMNIVVDYIKNGNDVFGCRDTQKACALENCKFLEEAKKEDIVADLIELSRTDWLISNFDDIFYKR